MLYRNEAEDWEPLTVSVVPTINLHPIFQKSGDGTGYDSELFLASSLPFPREG